MKIKILFLVVLISTIARSQISTTSVLVPTITNAGLGDLYLTSDTKQLYIGLSNGTLSLIGNENDWSLNGNSNASWNSFLGTTTDQGLVLKSNNTTIFQLGKRGKLGITSGNPGYNNPDQYMAYLSGDGTSALQFQADIAPNYKPIIYTTTEGNFRIKGAAAPGVGFTDFFEMGSAGTNDNGSLEFITGDDGTEPIVFKKSHPTDGVTEMMRIQGQGSGATNTTRVGIMTNGAVANSVLQVGGSVSLPIRTVTASTTLTDKDYTLIVKPGTYSGTAITLPYASTCKGRIYIIRNISGDFRSITSFYDKTGVAYASILNGGIVTLQSDGADFHQIGG